MGEFGLGGGKIEIAPEDESGEPDMLALTGRRARERVGELIVAGRMVASVRLAMAVESQGEKWAVRWRARGGAIVSEWDARAVSGGDQPSERPLGETLQVWAEWVKQWTERREVLQAAWRKKNQGQQSADGRPTADRVPREVVIDMDKKCAECGKPGAVVDGGLCLECVNEEAERLTGNRPAGGKAPVLGQKSEEA
ncbi:MAG: hypothetical protein PHR35_23530 [Kiritimatiellae bacterium]|nr:hypothetical protein [Kiritimatiellia bacterium]